LAREKVVAASAGRFVVIADSTKPVVALHAPVPLELLAFGVASTVRRLGAVSVRDVGLSPDGGVIADYTREFSDPVALAAQLAGTAGVLEHGLFPPAMVSVLLVARGTSVEMRTPQRHPPKGRGA
jgi:ribose 5-phosphate isomerase A